MRAKSLISLMLVILVLLCPSGCMIEKGSTSFGGVELADKPVSPPKLSEWPSGLLPPVKPLPLQIEYSELWPLKEGKFTVNITDISIVDNVSEIDNINGFLGSDSNVTFIKDNEERLVLRWPEFVNDDGSFYKGAYLIVVYMDVTNNNAVCYTKSDIRQGEFEDPFVFRADALLTLLDAHKGVTVTSNGELLGTAGVTVDYYSRINEYSDSYIAYRIQPGETVSFSVGFLVSDIREGGTYDLSTLYLARDLNNIFTRLDIMQMK